GGCGGGEAGVKPTLREIAKRMGGARGKTVSDSHGVFSRGCRRLNTSGSCRYVAIEYVMRDAPITPAFVAMKRIVAARTPTYTFASDSRNPCRPRFSTSPSTGSFLKPCGGF